MLQVAEQRTCIVDRVLFGDGGELWFCDPHAGYVTEAGGRVINSLIMAGGCSSGLRDVLSVSPES